MMGVLREGQSLVPEPLWSENHRFMLAYQGDGNLVLYRTDLGPWTPLWASNTGGTSYGQAVLQGDGNLVVYNAEGQPVWSSGTSDHPGAELALQNDGNLVIYHQDQPIWSSGTVQEPGGQAPPPPAPEPPPPPPQPAHPPQPSSSGGLRLSVQDTSIRPRLRNVEFRRFVSWRGRFQFPPPWNTEGIRVTNSEDSNGQDGVQPVGYPYWRRINAHAGRPDLLVLVGIDRRSGGQGPTLFRVTKQTGAVQNLGPLFAGDNPLSWDLAEEWYWSARLPDSLYLIQDDRLIRLNVQSGVAEVVMTAPDGHILKQAHTSWDDQTHSATVRERGGDWGVREMLVSRHGVLHRITVPPSLDEGQVDASGEYLLVKLPIDGKDGNGIRHLPSGREWTLRDGEGRVGHSDCGFGYVVGEDSNKASQGGSFRFWELTPDGPRDHGIVYHMHQWDSMSRHISHTNAQPGLVRDQIALVSSAHDRSLVRANEVVAIKFGTEDILSVCPNLGDLTSPGGNLGGDEENNRYRKLPKANLDPYGDYFCLSGNLGSERMDVFLGRMPPW